MKVYNDEIYHYGKRGMKWGSRRSYGKIPTMLTANRQLSADTKTLDKMNNRNYHTSVGLTKKRQSAYDKRDKKFLENRIDKNTVKYQKSLQERRVNGTKHVANALRLLGANAARAHTLHDTNKMSKMMFPD